ncbi:MAG: class B sortase [Lachnospiraceae bacterium]|nr:class B sortase [Lachnospiraceae bacterium]
MTADELTVAGRRFRTRKDYEAALRDEEKIKHIKTEKDLNNPKQLYELFSELKSGTYRFETIVGTDFDDEIYEKVEDLKKRGITPQNAGQFCSAGKKKKLSEKKKIKKENGEKNSKKVPDKKAGIADDAKLRRQILNELQKREKRRKLIVVLASLVAVLCFGYFGVYYFFSARTSMDYETLASLKGSDVLSTAPGKNEVSLHKTGFQLPDVLDEYKTLYEKNKKLIGWLKIDDTNIDYPVMQTSDNDYYLEHNYNQEYDKNGSIFMDCNCSIYPRSTNLILYGHHMKSGKMFGQLQKYAKESYGKEHAIIQFDTIYEKSTYQVMFVFRSQVYNDNDIVFKYYQFINANSEEEFNYYMNEMSILSLYYTGVTASYGDSLLTLSTCDSSQTDGRFVVVAKRI